MSDTNPVNRTLGRLHRPEYTGENRCIPCTVTNVAIAAGIGVLIGIASLPLGVGAFGASLGLIYLRGYLIPYTPTLTKRHFPDRVLRLFDKRPEPAFEANEDGLVDVQATLDAMGLVQPCEREDDICLDPGFRSEWRSQMERYDGDDDQIHAVASLIDVDAGQLSTAEYGSAVVVHYDMQKVGQWESDAALTADVAASEVLEESSPEWTRLDPVNRGRILNSLRMFVERCPDCGGATTLGQETVESCCRSIDVAAVTCADCGARLFELELDTMPASS